MSTRFLRRRRLWALLSACCVLAGVTFYLCRPSPVQRLQAYLGKDLRALSEDEQIEFDSLIAQLAPEARAFRASTGPLTGNPREWWDCLTAKPVAHVRRSWYLWRVPNGHGQDRLVLFQGEPLWVIPSSSSARIYVFDPEGRLLTKCEFPTGWRITIKDARWLEDSGHGFPCLRVCSAASINGADIASQYYAFLDDNFALVRLETSAGADVPIFWSGSNHDIGPPAPKRTPEQWEMALRSSNQAQVLQTLVWLGGHHPDLPFLEKYGAPGQFEEATRALATRARPEVRSVVETLTRSEDLWLREAAQTAWEADRAQPGGR
jgi:hypothetical protein